MKKEIQNMMSVLNLFSCEYELLDNSSNSIYKSNNYDIIKNSAYELENNMVRYDDKYYEYSKKDLDIDDVKYQIKIYFDVTKYQNAILALKEDILTSLPNRYAIEMFLNSYTGNETIAVICDLDDFKNINDTYGHQQGDVVLREFGHILKHLLSQNIFVGRYGGEEFVMFFKGSNLRFVKDQLINIRKAMANNPDLTNDKYQMKLSVGISKINKEKSLRDGIKEADIALYYVKNNGKSADAIYDSETNNCYIIE